MHRTQEIITEHGEATRESLARGRPSTKVTPEPAPDT